jgi:beta-lactamase class A
MSRSPQTALTQLFTSSQAQSDWFTPEFLRQVPLAQLQQLVTGIERDLGAYQDVQMAGDRFLVRFERGQIEAHISLNREGQIAGLLLQPVPNAITLDQAIEQLKTFPGQVNFLVLEESSERAALNADQPLAVGSTFKLAVLSALRQQIESEQRHWNDVVELQSAWKSLPSGILQDWPSDSWVTLQTLATLMISISDNTATDALIHVLGRDAIEAFTERNRPLLTTREFFTLKAPQYQDVLQRYRAANTAERRRILDQLAEYPLPNLTSSSGEGLFADGPTALDIEYFFTPHELCRLMSNVKDLSLMHVNPGTGLLNPSDWAQVAYKGGSEPGVLNLTHWLESPTGKTYCVVTTWNNVAAPLDETRLYNLHRAVIQGLQ